MTCFWNAIISSLTKEDKNILGIQNKLYPKIIVEILKNKNDYTPDVLWNNEEIRKQQQKENIEHKKDLDVNGIGRGYLCSTCDPFLILLSQLLEVTVKHNYNGVTIIYKNKKNERRIINYGSDKGHFWLG